MKILGLVSETHDAGVALLQDGVPVLVIEEERLNRRKHTLDFPEHALEEASEFLARGLADIDVITTPWDLARLRQTAFKAVFRHFPASLALLLPSMMLASSKGEAKKTAACDSWWPTLTIGGMRCPRNSRFKSCRSQKLRNTIPRS